MVRKVVMPAMSSVRTSVPLSVKPKYRSTNDLSLADLVGSIIETLLLRPDHRPADAKKRKAALHPALEGPRDLGHQSGKSLLERGGRGTGGVSGRPHQNGPLGLDGVDS